MTLGSDALATPPHHMTKADYPFDDGGAYVDSWAAEGSRSYPTSTDTDESDEGRTGRAAAKAKAAQKEKAEARAREAAREKAAARAKEASKPAAKGKTKPAPTVKGSKSASKPEPKKSTSKAEPKKPAAKPAPAKKYTTVAKDTLYGISKKFGASVAAIKKANGLKSDTIRPGMSLTIPK